MCYSLWCNTQSSAPENGQNNCPKHVEMIGIINKPLLLHLVGCLYYLLQKWYEKQTFILIALVQALVHYGDAVMF